MRVWSLGWEDPLEEEMATHTSILAWEIPWTKEPGELQSTGSKELDITEWLGHNKLWNILKEMRIPDTWAASWEICMQVKKQQLELNMEQQTGFK